MLKKANDFASKTNLLCYNFVIHYTRKIKLYRSRYSIIMEECSSYVRVGRISWRVFARLKAGPGCDDDELQNEVVRLDHFGKQFLEL